MSGDNGPPRAVWQQTTTPTGATVAYRLTDTGDRLVVTDLYLRRETGLAARDVANVPVRHLEAVAEGNAAAIRSATSPVDDEERNLALLLEVLTGGGAKFGHGTARVTVTASATSNRSEEHEPERLGRPKGGDPEFYRRVADRYRVYAAQGNKPTATIAAEAEVPLTTVQRWVQEARRRGFLAPGRPGVHG